MKILITGASSGIGFLTGITLASRNHKVIMTSHNEKQLENLNNKIKALNLDIETLKLDITNDEDVSMFKNLDIDILINHAGIGIGGSIIDLDMDEVKNNFEVNFFASYRLVKMFCNKKLKANQKGKVIITSSIAGIIPVEFLGSYCSSKAAITMMARCLRKELNILECGIDISVIEPGAYYTGFNQVMVDKILDMDSNSCFYTCRQKIYNQVKMKFDLIEKKNINSIVCQIIKAVEDRKNKFIYTAPLSQAIAKKIYALLFY